MEVCCKTSLVKTDSLAIKSSTTKTDSLVTPNSAVILVFTVTQKLSTKLVSWLTPEIISEYPLVNLKTLVKTESLLAHKSSM
jgi:hypothetical protein